ncbi:hypothetical protein ACN6LI_000999 [Streptomyces violaceoruber]
MTTRGSAGLGARQEWEPEDLIEVWTLLEEDQERLRHKSGANLLEFALLPNSSRWRPGSRRTPGRSRCRVCRTSPSRSR